MGNMTHSVTRSMICKIMRSITHGTTRSFAHSINSHHRAQQKLTREIAKHDAKIAHQNLQRLGLSRGIDVFVSHEVGGFVRVVLLCFRATCRLVFFVYFFFWGGLLPATSHKSASCWGPGSGPSCLTVAQGARAAEPDAAGAAGASEAEPNGPEAEIGPKLRGRFFELHTLMARRFRQRGVCGKKLGCLTRPACAQGSLTRV